LVVQKELVEAAFLDELRVVCRGVLVEISIEGELGSKREQSYEASPAGERMKEREGRGGRK